MKPIISSDELLSLLGNRLLNRFYNFLFFLKVARIFDLRLDSLIVFCLLPEVDEELARYAFPQSLTGLVKIIEQFREVKLLLLILCNWRWFYFLLLFLYLLHLLGPDNAFLFLPQQLLQIIHEAIIMHGQFVLVLIFLRLTFGL